MDEDTSVNPPPSPKAERAPGPTEVELSRIAREAVHQAPDARLDKQLARMGLLDASEPADPKAGQTTSAQPAIDAELEHLRGQLRRVEGMLWGLVAVIAILGGVIIVLITFR